MYRDLEHPEITRCIRTGYPSRMQEDDYDQNAYEAYCDRCYEENRDRELFGELRGRGYGK